MRSRTRHLVSRLPVAPAAVAMLAGMAMLAGAAVTTGCDEGAAPAPANLTIVTTTGYLADAANNIAPNAKIRALVGPGADPHTYQPSTRDIQAIQSADLILWNGLGLEPQFVTPITSLGQRQLAVGDALPAEELIAVGSSDAAGPTHYDPHVWNDPELWSQVVQAIARKLESLDPVRANDYRQRAESYVSQISEAHAQAYAALATIPPHRRILVTGHDAFGYFGRTFDIEIHATDFISTEALIGPGKLSALAELIAERKIPEIFQDSQANPQAMTSLLEAAHARGWYVRIAEDELYADSLGVTPDVDTYLGAFTHNASAMARALATTDQEEAA